MPHCRRDLKACRNCAYLALEPGHEDTDICTHRLSPLADVAPTDYCPYWSNELDVSLVCGCEDGDEPVWEDMPNVRREDYGL